MTNLKRQGGWKSDTVVEGYLRNSKKLKADTAALISGGVHHNQSVNIATSTSTATTQATSSVNFENSAFHNCTFNVTPK